MWKVTHTHNTNTHNTSGVLQCIVWEWVFCWTRSCGWSAQVVDDGEGVNGCSVLTATWIASFLKPLSESRAPHPHHYQLCRALCWLCWLSLSSTKCQNAKVKTTETWQLFTGWWAKNISEVLWKMNREKLLLTTCPTVMKMVTFRFFSLSFFKQPTVWPAEASKMTKWGSLDTFRRPSCFQMVQETNIPRHRFYIHTLYKIENKDESLEKNLLCNLLCPDNMHNYIPPKDNKTHFHIVKLWVWIESITQ